MGPPTDVQREAWPRIAGGEHLLITAPTGSGKTLAAFLWALNELIAGRWPSGNVSVLYVSPLRALNYDIQRNLLRPLEELQQAFAAAGEPFREVRVLTRSGDTPQAERRQMLRHPPEILITTPESLNLLLSSAGGRSILGGLQAVILDEIHAVFGTKRGAYLITAVDRLVRLCGEFQRIALSATLPPLEEAAAFVGGFRMEKSPALRYLPRPVAVVSSAARKRYVLEVRATRQAGEPEPGSSIWEELAGELKKIIARNRSTLIFVNSRRLCETLTLFINAGGEEPLAYAHHGSLALEIRREVERRLKAGELKAIVATHSLELGIDIGALDEVVLVQSPFSISSAVQRVGRAGHQVGEVSRGTFLPTFPKDLLEAAVLAPEIQEGDIEPARPVLLPLDVLAQIIVSMTGVEKWKIDDLYENIRTSFPYRHLGREPFDLVLHMLAGRYAGSRLRELRPLISLDRVDQTVEARRGALQTLYFSGGVIPDRGYFHLRHEETNARLGELDEEFVWEASPGDTMALGAQTWRIQRITHNDVLVVPAAPGKAAAPFWKAEENGRDFHFSERIANFLEEADARLEDPGFFSWLMSTHFLEPGAARQLIDFLKSQKEATGSALPHRHHLLVERVSSGPGGAPGSQAVIHTLWGGRVNRPLALALDAAWQARFGYRLEIFVSNDCVVFVLPHETGGEELLSLIGSAQVESLLRSRLEGSGFFGARFRECAGRALLLPRERFNERMPLWLSRLRSQKLLEAVREYEDFPILLETWRTCLKDEFDLPALKQLLTELESGAVAWSEARTSQPSPFARSDWWRQVNQYVYMDDTPRSEMASRLRGSLLRDIIHTPGLLPTVARDLVKRFEAKRQRLSPGYAPQSARELLDWTVERLMIPQEEWTKLLAALRRDHGLEPEKFLEELPGKLVLFHPPEAAEPLVAAREMLSRLLRNLHPAERSIPLQPLIPVPLLPAEEMPVYEGEKEDGGGILGEWLRFYGPITPAFVERTLGLKRERLQELLEDLLDGQTLIQGRLVADGPPDEICDTENFEILLRMSRAAAVPVFEALAIDWLPLFLAHYQGLTSPREEMEGLYQCIEQLLCYPAEAEAWEEEIFPARLRRYDPSWLDTLMQEEELQWVGGEGHRLAFCFSSDLDLLQEAPSEPPAVPPEKGPPAGLFPDDSGRYDFSTLVRAAQTSSSDVASRLWDAVWQGQVTSDSFVPLRRAILNRFKLPDLPGEKSRRRLRRRARFPGTQEARFYGGHWHLLPRPASSGDLLEAEEARKDRVRLLLNRYGILFRELLQRELPPLRWAAIFRSLRIMELSGEVLSGFFFDGIPGPQFISPRAFRILQSKLPEEAVYWINAADPASLCGLPLEPLRGKLPPRVASTHLVYRGTHLAVVSKRNGAELAFHVPPDDPRLPEYLGFLRHLLTRPFQPIRRISIETINGERAPQSPYLSALRTSFDVLLDYRGVNLYRKMG